MIAAIAGLLACQLIGEILVRALLLPLPGPVAGLALLFLFLVWHGHGKADPADTVPLELGRVTDVLLRNLSLLFIPAAVGVVQYLDLLRANALAIATAIVLSTTLTLIVTAVTFRLVSRLHAFRRKEPVEAVEAAVEPRRHP